MKKLIFTIAAICGIQGGSILVAQDIKSSKVPAAVTAALMKKYPVATKITWEKGNYEGNWGGKSGEDMSVTFTPAGAFVEQVEAIKTSALPATVTKYLQAHYKGVKVDEAGKATAANGTITYEAIVKHKEVVFDAQGNFLKVE
ncbi:hypothetical protein [Mucilaginibacter antarcticus]|uniref:hypothetical protein n=1 Tax=Mucilaginibacter antarcticus TaxID=1855725 RepID=UPI003632EB51